MTLEKGLIGLEGDSKNVCDDVVSEEVNGC